MNDKLPPKPGQPMEKKSEPDKFNDIGSIANCVIWVIFIVCVTFIIVKLINLYQC